MNQSEPDTPADVPSPCMGICIIGAEDHCIGCFRSRDELAAWWTARSAEKRAILARCRERERKEKAG